ncbi:type IV pilus assembly PilZ [Mahella australiensis 50-1 BON]|uniref:Type IV pilus assembly PilZ n=2 Tax=Mahella TaxID=252965 RepID=F4A1V9_MAHA5|nr:type IV pilus assembly PilZ [Mahella australiensis 50-1 BON]
MMVYNDYDLNVGERIELEVEDDNGVKTTYISQVYNVLDQNHIVIAGPIKKGKIVLLSVGQPLGVIYYRSDGCYRICAKITQRLKMDKDVYIYTIEAMGARERIQRRNYYRLGIVLPVQFRKMTESGDKNQFALHKAYTLDISGGGMRITVSKRIPIKERDLLQCHILLDDDVKLEVKGIVVRIAGANNDSDTNEIGVEFQDISNQVRDKLISFIFKQQLKFLQKGLK